MFAERNQLTVQRLTIASWGYDALPPINVKWANGDADFDLPFMESLCKPVSRWKTKTSRLPRLLFEELRSDCDWVGVAAPGLPLRGIFSGPTRLSALG